MTDPAAEGLCQGHNLRQRKFGWTFPDVPFKDLLPKCPLCDEVLVPPTETWGEWTPFPVRMHADCRAELDKRLNSFAWIDPPATDDDEDARAAIDRRRGPEYHRKP